MASRDRFLHAKLKASVPFLCAIILMLTFSAGAFSLKNNFKTREDRLLVVSPEAATLAYFGEVLSASQPIRREFYGPFFSVILRIERHLFGLNAFYYYLTNVCLHAVISVSIFILMMCLLRRKGMSFLIALLFAIHPVHGEVVSYIPGQAILWTAFLLILTLIMFIEADKKQFLFLFSLLLFLLALLCGESAAIFPWVLLAYCYFFKNLSLPKGKNWFVPALPFFLVEGICIMLRCYPGLAGAFTWSQANQAGLNFLTFLKGMVDNLRILFFPIDLHVGRLQQVSSALRDGDIYVIIFFACILALFKLRKRLGQDVKFFMVWFLLEQIGAFWLFGAANNQLGYLAVSESFLYMPSLSFCGILAMLFYTLKERDQRGRFFFKKIIPASIAGIYALFYVLAVQYNLYAGDEMVMLKRALRFTPENTRIRISLAGLYLKNQQYPEAEAQYRTALEFDSSNMHTRITLGDILCRQGRYWEGIAEYEKAARMSSPGDRMNKKINSAYQALIGVYHDAIKGQPDEARNYFELGLVYEKTLDLDRAIAYYKKAIVLMPDFKEALYHMGIVYEDLAQWDLALDAYKQLIALRDFSTRVAVQACFRASKIFQQLGQPEKYKEFVEDAWEYLQQKNKY